MAVVFTYRLPIRPMSCRRKHHHGHVNSAASSISLPSDAPAAMPVEALAPPAFSALLTAHLGESQLQTLSTAGFLDDADVAGLTAQELCGLCPTLHHDDAVAALAVAQHHKRISSLPESSTGKVFAEQHPSSAKVRRTLFRPAASSLSPITDGKAKLLDEFWQIMCNLGRRGFGSAHFSILSLMVFAIPSVAGWQKLRKPHSSSSLAFGVDGLSLMRDSCLRLFYPGCLLWRLRMLFFKIRACVGPQLLRFVSGHVMVVTAYRSALSASRSFCNCVEPDSG